MFEIKDEKFSLIMPHSLKILSDKKDNVIKTLIESKMKSKKLSEEHSKFSVLKQCEKNLQLLSKMMNKE